MHGGDAARMGEIGCQVKAPLGIDLESTRGGRMITRRMATCLDAHALMNVRRFMNLDY